MIKNFSRSVRRQLLTTDLAYALVNNLLETGQLKYNERQCAMRIDMRIKNIKHIIYGGDKLLLSKKELRLYSREVNKLLAFVESMEVDRSHFHGLTFFNSVLLVVSDVRENVKKSKNSKLKREWLMVDQMLNTLYRYADLNLEYIDTMATGQLHGEEIIRMIN